MNRSLRNREGREGYIRQREEMGWQVSGKGKRVMHPTPILSSLSPTPAAALVIQSAASTAPQYLWEKVVLGPSVWNALLSLLHYPSFVPADIFQLGKPRLLSEAFFPSELEHL